MSSLSLPVCELANSVLEPDLREAAVQGVIADIEILETRCAADVAPAYFVTVRMHWSGKKTWYLTTRRRRDRPRLFKQIAVLLELLRDIAPDPITLRRDVALPAPPGGAPGEIVSSALPHGG